MSDLYLLILGLGVVFICSLVIFWPKKKTDSQDKDQEYLYHFPRKTTVRGFVGPSGKQYGTTMEVDLNNCGIDNEDDDLPIINPISSVMAVQAIMNPDTFSPVVLPQYDEEPQKYVDTSKSWNTEGVSDVFTHHETGSQVVESSTSFTHHDAESQVTTPTFSESYTSYDSSSSDSSSSSDGGSSSE